MPNLNGWKDILYHVCHGKRSFEELKKIDLKSSLHKNLSWAQRKALDDMAPARIELPSGSYAWVQYRVNRPPLIEVRIQQVFGMDTTPRIDGEPIQLSLLAPNNRPQQLTSDIGSFWSESYPAIRKELRGRYPKHAWPEVPERKDATDRTKKRQRGGGKKTK